jgi:hypothetical protein
MTYHQKIEAAWMQMAVLSSNNPECMTLLPLLQNKGETYFVNFSRSPAGSVPGQVEAI